MGLTFNGSSDYVDCGSGLTTSGALTVEAMVTPNTLAGSYFLRIIHRANDDGKGFSLRWNAGRFHFQSKLYDIDMTAMSDTNFIVGTTYHVVGVYDGSSIRIYINAVLQTSTFSDGAGDGGGVGTDIGRRANDSNSIFYANGSIRYVRVYNRVLSLAEVSNNYSGSVPTKTGLVSEWLFNEGLGTIAHDSKNANNGTLHGCTWNNDVNNRLNWTSADSVNFWDWNRIESNISTLYTYLQSIQYVVPSPVTPNTTRTVSSIDYLTSINRIENNIDAIRLAFINPVGYLGKKSWTVGQLFDFNDANRLEGNVKQLYDLGVTVYQNYRYCGTQTCGEWGLIY